MLHIFDWPTECTMPTWGRHFFDALLCLFKWSIFQQDPHCIKVSLIEMNEVALVLCCLAIVDVSPRTVSQEVFPQEVQATVCKLPSKEDQADYKEGQAWKWNCLAKPNFGSKPFSSQTPKWSVRGRNIFTNLSSQEKNKKYMLINKCMCLRLGRISKKLICHHCHSRQQKARLNFCCHTAGSTLHQCWWSLSLFSYWKQWTSSMPSAAHQHCGEYTEESGELLRGKHPFRLSTFV